MLAVKGCYLIISLNMVVSEPEFDFAKPLNDTDAHEKEPATFLCEVNDPDAKVQWFRENEVSYEVKVETSYKVTLCQTARGISNLKISRSFYNCVLWAK